MRARAARLMNNAVKSETLSVAQKPEKNLYRSIQAVPSRRLRLDARARASLSRSEVRDTSAYGSGATMDMSTGRRISPCASPNTMHRKSCLKKVMKTTTASRRA